MAHNLIASMLIHPQPYSPKNRIFVKYNSLDILQAAQASQRRYIMCRDITNLISGKIITRFSLMHSGPVIATRWHYSADGIRDVKIAWVILGLERNTHWSVTIRQ